MNERTNKLLIAIDGNSLMHRAFYALPDMKAKDGTPTGALYGFMTMLLSLVKREPDYMMVAFDMHGPTFRHEQYSDYKAGRRPTPDDLRTQFPILKELLTQLGIRICECERYEADDILGTIAKQSEKANIDTLLVSGDRDGLQLVSDHIHVLLTKKGISETVEFTPSLLMETYGLKPDNMRDLKGLMGDSSDHIPGIPGVGEKTALGLLATYGTLENVIAHGNEIKGKLGEKVCEYAQSARMSYEIGTIDTNAPIGIGAEDCVFFPESMDKAVPLLSQLNMMSIIDKLPSGKRIVEEEQMLRIEKREIGTEEELRAFVSDAKGKGTVAITFEPELSFADTESVSYVLEKGETLFDQGIPFDTVIHMLGELMEDPAIDKIIFDYKRAMHEFGAYGISICGTVKDIMIAEYLLNSLHPSGTFGELCAHFGGIDEPTAAAIYHIEREQKASLERDSLIHLYNEMEIPLAKVLFRMEETGALVDESVLENLNSEFEERIQRLKSSIYEMAGEEFNILSPKQLGTLLFEKMNLPAGKKTKQGYSTDADTLEKLRTKSPIISPILEYRFLTKLKSTFVDGLLQARNKEDGRVRSRFNQCMTATGRISSSEPNLQNIPVRTDVGREIRRAFVASPGSVLIDADYSQIELRILAHLSEDEHMINSFVSGEDIHRRTASEVFDTPLEEVSSEQRSAAKAVNFGIVYGISDFGLSNNLGIPVSTAREYIKMYFSRYPKIKRFMDECVETGKRKGYAETIFGRRRPLPELSSNNYNIRSFGERVAMNMPIQGSAADIIKMAMCRVQDALEGGGYSSKLILQVHDELLLDVVEEEKEAVYRLVKDSMENVISLSVPLIADVEIGSNWYETK